MPGIGCCTVISICLHLPPPLLVAGSQRIYRSQMAYTQTMSSQAIHQHYRDVHAPTTPPTQRRLAQKLRFLTDLSQCLFDFVIQLLPTTEELAVKEDVRKLLERLIRTIEPDSRLLSFGSTANGFSLRNSGTFSTTITQRMTYDQHLQTWTCAASSTPRSASLLLISLPCSVTFWSVVCSTLASCSALVLTLG
jgi:hypothetical protein